MANVLISPAKYVQGYGEIRKINDYIDKLGDKFLVVIDPMVYDEMVKTISEAMRDESRLVFEKFGGECTRNECDRLGQIYKTNKCNAVIGIGGGKALDTAKGVVYYQEGGNLIVIPSIASTDAPTSSLAVLYTEKGEFDGFVALPKNPDLVLVDTALLAKAPVRLFVAGMGDALSTLFEARANQMKEHDNYAGGKYTNASLALAKLCYDILIADGLKAKIANENGTSSKAFENVVEANIYLSGVGFESNGCACAHSIYNGFTILPQCHHMFHGELVAFGTIVQLVLENRPMAEIGEVINFCISVGLPVTLNDISDNLSQEDLINVAIAACDEGSFMDSEPFEVTPEMTYSAIMTADALGKLFKSKQ